MRYTTNCICARSFKFVGQPRFLRNLESSTGARFCDLVCGSTRLRRYSSSRCDRGPNDFVFFIPLTNTYLISYTRAGNVAISSAILCHGIEELVNEFERFRS